MSDIQSFCTSDIQDMSDIPRFCASDMPGMHYYNSYNYYNYYYKRSSAETVIC